MSGWNLYSLFYSRHVLRNFLFLPRSERTLYSIILLRKIITYTVHYNSEYLTKETKFQSRLAHSFFLFGMGITSDIILNGSKSYRKVLVLRPQFKWHLSPEEWKLSPWASIFFEAHSLFSKPVMLKFQIVDLISRNFCSNGPSKVSPTT